MIGSIEFDVAAMEDRCTCSSGTVFVIRHFTLSLAGINIVGFWQMCHSDCRQLLETIIRYYFKFTKEIWSNEPMCILFP
jgi:hypothetical protein